MMVRCKEMCELFFSPFHDKSETTFSPYHHSRDKMWSMVVMHFSMQRHMTKIMDLINRPSSLRLAASLYPPSHSSSCTRFKFCSPRDMPSGVLTAIPLRQAKKMLVTEETRDLCAVFAMFSGATNGGGGVPPPCDPVMSVRRFFASMGNMQDPKIAYSIMSDYDTYHATMEVSC